MLPVKRGSELLLTEGEMKAAIVNYCQKIPNGLLWQIISKNKADDVVDFSDINLLTSSFENR